MEFTYWTAEQKTVARRMKAQHRTHSEIAAAIGRTHESVKNFFYDENLNVRLDLWTDEEVAILRREVRAGKIPKQIALLLPNRTAHGIKNKIDHMRRKGILVKEYDRQIVTSIKVDEHIWAERDKRSNEPRTLSMIMFGDPPPSQSALGRPCS